MESSLPLGNEQAMEGENTMTRNRRRTIKRELLSKDPHCFWCGKEVTLDVHWGPHEKVPSNFATIEHLVPRRAGRMADFERNLRIACPTCNK